MSARDDEVFRGTTETRETTRQEVAAAIEANNACPRWVALAKTGQDGALLGNISLVPEPDGRWGEISYWLAPEGRGWGAASAALKALTNWAFASWSVEGLFLKIAADNIASIAVATRCGFTEAGPSEERLRFARRKPT